MEREAAEYILYIYEYIMYNWYNKGSIWEHWIWTVSVVLFSAEKDFLYPTNIFALAIWFGMHIANNLVFNCPRFNKMILTCLYWLYTGWTHH